MINHVNKKRQNGAMRFCLVQSSDAEVLFPARAKLFQIRVMLATSLHLYFNRQGIPWHIYQVQ